MSTDALPGFDKPRRESSEAARASLGDAAFDLAWSQGWALDQATAIALALDERPSSAAEETTGPRKRAPGSVLTRREHQIADMVQQGLSNKEIAETRVISARTAETHVENILTKLGFTKRTQVAAWIGHQPRSGETLKASASHTDPTPKTSLR